MDGGNAFIEKVFSMAISDTIKKGVIRAPHRSLLRATGVVKSEGGFRKALYRGL